MMRVFVKRETDRARDCNTSLLIHVLITPVRLAGHQAQAGIQRACVRREEKKKKKRANTPLVIPGRWTDHRKRRLVDENRKSG